MRHVIGASLPGYPYDSALLAAYTKNVGHPPVERYPQGTPGWEQWYWPNAKRRKYNRLTLEQVALIEVRHTQEETP